MMEMFDRGIQLRMGQAHVRRWTDDILPLLLDPADPLGVHWTSLPISCPWPML